MHPVSRLWNTTSGQCLKTLVENGNVIWCASAVSILTDR